MPEKQSKPCRIEGKKLIPCVGLAKTLELPGYKGLVMNHTMNWKTREQGSFVSAHCGEYRKQGLTLNYCPFCGEDIVSHIVKKGE